MHWCRMKPNLMFKTNISGQSPFAGNVIIYAVLEMGMQGNLNYPLWGGGIDDNIYFPASYVGLYNNRTANFQCCSVCAVGDLPVLIKIKRVGCFFDLNQ